MVPLGTGRRIGIDRDEDGFFDRDELDACSDPANPNSTPDNVKPADADFDGDVDLVDYGRFTLCFTGPDELATRECACVFDFDDDSDVDLTDLGEFIELLTGP